MFRCYSRLCTRMSSPPVTSYDAADNYFEPAMIMFKKREKGNFKPVIHKNNNTLTKTTTKT